MCDCLAHYRFAMHAITCPREYTPLEIECSENDSHHFMNLWVKYIWVEWVHELYPRADDTFNSLYRLGSRF
jgi:hypothetical protein